MADEELTPRESVELMIQARDALESALQQAVADLPPGEREGLADQEVMGYSARRFARTGSVHINIPKPGETVSLNPQPLPPGEAWVSINPQPLPPKYLTSGIIIVSG